MEVFMSGNVVDVTDQNFDSEVLGSNLPTLLDFWAEWCQPCKMIAPVIEELAGEYDGKIRFGKMNIDHSPSTPTKFGIKGIPTLILFRDGQVVEQVVGVRSKNDLKTILDKTLES